MGLSAKNKLPMNYSHGQYEKIGLWILSLALPIPDQTRTNTIDEKT